MNKLELTQLEYGVLIQAINDAIDKNIDGDFIDPYNNEEGFTEDEVTEALKRCENKIYAIYTGQGLIN